MNFEKDMKERIKDIEQVIENYMPKEAGLQKTVIEAMQYTMSAGGKRIRPLLMKEMYEFFGGTGQIIEPFMAAMEMIHTYSLIHDDLPALDNDDYRRGRKTAHIVYGEAMAILAGKKVIIIGDRDGVPGPAIAECVQTAGGEVVYSSTECFV